jgi:hypothetical protein
MSKNRLEAFSDGVIAIIITVMVLELKIPHGAGLDDLVPMIPVLSSYILSFVYIAIYLEQSPPHVPDRASDQRQRLVGQHAFAVLAVAHAIHHSLGWRKLFRACTGGGLWLRPTDVWDRLLYLGALFGAGRAQAPIAKALGKDFKGKVSVVMYAIAIPLAWLHPALALLIYVAVAAIWFVPDRRMERVLKG